MKAIVCEYLLFRHTSKTEYKKQSQFKRFLLLADSFYLLADSFYLLPTMCRAPPEFAT